MGEFLIVLKALASSNKVGERRLRRKAVAQENFHLSASFPDHYKFRTTALSAKWIESISAPPQVSVSNTHIVALTSDLLVFTWGEGRRGQLGHGEVESWRSRPCCVEALKTKSITHVGAGDGFSVFTRSDCDDENDNIRSKNSNSNNKSSIGIINNSTYDNSKNIKEI